MHQVHHSATILTPLTSFREHYFIIFSNSIGLALTSGIVQAAWSYFSARPPQVEILGTGYLGVYLIRRIQFLIGHSEKPMSFGKLNYIFISPSMHRIHHSTDSRHHNKNFGGLFSFWDFCFKTAYNPRQSEAMTTKVSLGTNKPWKWNSYIYKLIPKNR